MPGACSRLLRGSAGVQIGGQADKAVALGDRPAGAGVDGEVSSSSSIISSIGSPVHQEGGLNGFPL